MRLIIGRFPAAVYPMIALCWVDQILAFEPYSKPAGSLLEGCITALKDVTYLLADVSVFQPTGGVSERWKTRSY